MQEKNRSIGEKENYSMKYGIIDTMKALHE
jgi:hypothetical protein